MLTRPRSVCALLFALRVCYSVCLYAYASLQSLRIQHLFVRSLCCGSVRGTFGKALALTRAYARLHIKGAAALGRQSRQPRTKRLCVYRSADTVERGFSPHLRISLFSAHTVTHCVASVTPNTGCWTNPCGAKSWPTTKEAQPAPLTATPKATDTPARWGPAPRKRDTSQGKIRQKLKGTREPTSQRRLADGLEKAKPQG